LQWVARDLGDAYPGIESGPDVARGGAVHRGDADSRLVLEQARRLGTTEAKLLASYPTLRAEDLANAWSYVRSHRDEIDQQIRENEGA